jgi:hypothetical protein
MPRGQPAGEEVYRPEVSPEAEPRKMVPQMREAPLAGGVEAITSAVQGKYQADSATYASNALANFRVESLGKLDEMKGAVPAGQDPGNFTESYLAQYDKAAQKLADESEGNSLARNMVSRGLEQMRARLAEHVQGWEAQTRVAYRDDSVRSNIRSQADVIEAHPELLPSVGATTMDAINAVGGDPTHRLVLGREMDAQYSLAAGYGLSRQDPRGVLTALNDPEHAPAQYGSLAHLNDAQREAVRARANVHLGDSVAAALSQGDISSAQHALNANADLMDPRTFETLQRSVLATSEHNLMMSQKWEKDTSERLTKQAITMQLSGQLTPDWIVKHQKGLEPAAYEHLLKMATGHDEAFTKPEVLADLTLRTLRGDDTTADWTKALTVDHTVTTTDFQKGVAEVAKDRPGWVKAGAGYIADRLKVSEMDVGPARATAEQSLAYGLRDWQDYVRDHPTATPTEAQKEQDQIVGSYGLVAEGKVSFFMPAPQHLLGTRQRPTDERGNPDPELKATVHRANEAYRNGEITLEERMEEARRIDALRALYQGQQAAAAAAKAKKANQ